MVDLLRKLITEQIQECNDEDLLDLVHKLLLTEGS